MTDLERFAGFCGNLLLEQGVRMTVEDYEHAILSDHFGGAREIIVLLPKKQGKTTLLAALALYHVMTVADAECVVAAASRDQAMILFDAAAGFVRRNPDLQLRLKIQGGYRVIRHLEAGGRIRVLAADVDTADGVRPTLALVDELHRHKSAALYGVFRDGLGPRQGRMITISTAGERETSPLGVIRTAARKLDDRCQDGSHLRAASPDGAFILHEWALQEGEEPDDIAAVKRCNPASWQTEESLISLHDSPTTLPWQWQRFHCNLWVSEAAWWIKPGDWAAGKTSARLEDGDEVSLGFDGARTDDATALIACRMSDGLIQPIQIWESEGDGWWIPEAEVSAAVADAFERYNVAVMFCDPPLWQSQIDEWAQQYGETVMRFATKRNRMVDAVERFRTDVGAGKVRHVEDAVLTRHVLNAQMREVRGGYWLVKPGAAVADKIDAAVAAVLAYEARADKLAQREKRKPGVLVTF